MGAPLRLATPVLAALLLASACTSGHEAPPLTATRVSAAQRSSGDVTPGGGVTASASSSIQPTGCVASGLAVRYYSGDPGAGNDIGSIVLANTTSRPCNLTGPLRVVGLDRVGGPVTNELTLSVQNQLVLTSRGYFPPAGEAFPATLRDAWIRVVAAYRDDPITGGLCAPHAVIPAIWKVTFPNGAALSVVNKGVEMVPGFAGLVTCRGRIGTTGQISRAFPS